MTGAPSILSGKKESTTDLFDVVSDDLLTLNKNLQSVSYLLLRVVLLVCSWMMLTSVTCLSQVC